MNRRIISYILVSSLLFSIGCYNHQTITKEQLKAITKEQFKAEFEYADITVFMKDSSECTFLKGNCFIHNDNLIGSGVHTIAGHDSSINSPISFADITSVESTEFSLEDTIGAIGAPVLATLLVYLILHNLSVNSRDY